MRESWKIQDLGNVCDILDNKRKPITKKDRIEGDYPYYGATGILSYVKNYLFDEQLVLLGEDGAKWESGDKSAFIINGKTWVNNHAHVLRPKREILNDHWLIYNLNFQNLLPFVSGMTVPKLNQGNMRKIQIPIPPLQEQHQIVAILDQAFAAIDQAKANIEKNIENAKELFQSKLNAVFSQRGEGWEEQEFANVIKLKSGQNLTSKNMVEGDYPVFGGNGIAGYHNKYNLSGKQIIIGRVGALCGNVRYLEQPIWLTDNAFQITNMKYDFDFQFLTYLLNHKNLRSLARQAAQPVISNSSLKDLILNFPKNITAQIKIRERISLLENEVEKIIIPYNNKLAALEELKKSILQKAFAGELTNKAVEV
ncbi:restriction endonuclease subunit S [Aequorivita todarodis]|uniref:restriction endonuclease subunit S n=1 Tax=Aequorivita todarodis TaxID=2036821 RepID=UPI00234FBEE3|nr:restriction endonuclease subunit S [Aequorivita todarodis]MDC7999696.1 restriction endonuclease subunit S [Aequorivita todarodis]